MIVFKLFLSHSLSSFKEKITIWIVRVFLEDQ